MYFLSKLLLDSEKKNIVFILEQYGRVTITSGKWSSPMYPPRSIFTLEAVDLGGMRGCNRKLWKNVREVIAKIEKTKTKTDKDKNEE